jgi:hypothetical protein
MLGLEIIKSIYVPQHKIIDSGWWKILFRYHNIPLILLVNGKIIIHPETFNKLSKMK